MTNQEREAQTLEAEKHLEYVKKLQDKEVIPFLKTLAPQIVGAMGRISPDLAVRVNEILIQDSESKTDPDKNVVEKQYAEQE